MKSFKSYISENKLAKGAKTGDIVKIGHPGYRGNNLTRVVHHTDKTVTVATQMQTFDRNSALKKGHDKKPTLGKTPVIHKASSKDIENHYRDQLINSAKKIDYSKLTTAQLEKHIKLHGEHTNTDYQFHHFKRGWVSSKKDM